MASDPFVIYHGGHAGKSQIKLNAGNLSLIYENGSLRYISAGNIEIIRMIYSAVRDKEWLTAPPEISNEVFNINPDSFYIKYKCRYSSGEIEFETDFLIEGGSDNSLSFSFEGEAKTTFEKSRIGFCVLHPIEVCSGNPCIIFHPDGTSEILYFPDEISPDQIFTDIRAMQLDVNGCKCRIDFEGDIFETEDQRNWTDASYKTYCTPLNLPLPVTVKKGERIAQRITVKLEGNVEEQPKDNVINLRILSGNISELPKIGIGRSTRRAPLTGNELKILRNLAFDHYRIDLYLFENDWRSKATSAVIEAESLGYTLELALFFDDDAINQCTGLIDWFSDVHADIYLMILYHRTEQSTPDILTDTVGSLLREVFPGIKIACGTNANFAELNRKRPETAQNDFICYSIHPQEHASDNSTLTENLKGQEYTVLSAAAFARGKDIWISPVNMQRRFNANISNYENPSLSDEFPPQADSRIMSLFGACWTAGSLKYLCESGIKGVTYFETAGERGIIQGDFEPKWPERFPSVKGMIFPVFHVFRFFLENRNFKFVKSLSDQPLKVDIAALSDQKTLKIMLINFTHEEQRVSSGFCHAPEITGELSLNTYNEVDENIFMTTGLKKTKNPEILILPPFSITFIESNYEE